MSEHESPKAVIAALLANLGIAATKVLGWLLTASSSMLAEAIHSFADCGNQALLLIGGRRSRRSPTRQHPFGYGAERFLYAFLVSVVLFTVGGLFALFEAYEKYTEVAAGHPDKLLSSRWWWVPLVILVLAIGMEGLSLRTALREGRKVRGGATWVEYIRRAKSPEIPVVLLEDTAALLGLTFALIGVGMTLLTDSGYWDVAGSAAIGLLLVTVAIVLGRETKSLLVGESADLQEQREIAAAISAGGHGLSIIHLRTLQLGPTNVLVACKIAAEPSDTAAELAVAIDAAEERIRAVVPDASYVFIEPDIARTSDSSAI